MSTERLAKLQQMLAKTPADPFLLYATAMEHKKLGDKTRAIDFFDRVIQADAGYCYAYYQKAQVLEQAGDLAQARVTYKAGMEAARTAGDAHALSELESALAMIG